MRRESNDDGVRLTWVLHYAKAGVVSIAVGWEGDGGGFAGGGEGHAEGGAGGVETVGRIGRGVEG